MATADPDAERARRLASLLEQLAERLESTDEALAMQIDEKKCGEPLAVARQRKSEARELVRRLHNVSRAVDAKNVSERAAQRRAALLSACDAAAAVLRHTRLGPRGVPRRTDNEPPRIAPLSFDGALAPGFEEAAVQLAVDLYVGDVEEHRGLARQHRQLIADLVRAKAKLPGAQRVPRAAEAAFEAFGFDADYDTAKSTRRRQRRSSAKAKNK